MQRVSWAARSTLGRARAFTADRNNSLLPGVRGRQRARSHPPKPAVTIAGKPAIGQVPQRPRNQHQGRQQRPQAPQSPENPHHGRALPIDSISLQQDHAFSRGCGFGGQQGLGCRGLQGRETKIICRVSPADEIDTTIAEAASAIEKDHCPLDLGLAHRFPIIAPC